MKVKTITVSRTFNMGDYNSYRLELTIEKDDNEKSSQIVDTANRFIKQEFSKILSEENGN